MEESERQIFMWYKFSLWGSEPYNKGIKDGSIVRISNNVIMIQLIINKIIQV